jgi:hypothetical protein
MSQIAAHPARDAEFLSRLHDGELNAAERAQFESHRAHCAECRNAAFDFEAALSLYRASRPRPAAPDLSARILHKLQRSHRRRPAFGASFGIDLRWAGAFAAAVIAAIIGFSIVARQEAVRKMAARTEAIPVTMEADTRNKEEAPKPSSEAAAKPAPAHGYVRRESALAKDAARDNEKTGQPKAAGRMQAPAAPANAAPIAPAPSAAERKEAAARDKTAALAPEPQAADRLDLSRNVAGTSQPSQPNGRVLYDRAGGDGANLTDSDFGALNAVHLTITAADGGSTPELLAGQKLDLPASERGREYSVSVDPQGRVSDVRRVVTVRQKAARAPSSADEKQVEAAQTVKAPQALWDLRFHPADRPRLVLVKVE